MKINMVKPSVIADINYSELKPGLYLDSDGDLVIVDVTGETKTVFGITDRFTVLHKNDGAFRYRRLPEGSDVTLVLSN